ncbi:MAG TPA: GNAT family N-acetyltransferase [bacterium (Candidatus Stahlbacteria)]|nr:GNAT family N-acetyltransferase [Candidatus Stahlbacteria bacterium]
MIEIKDYHDDHTLDKASFCILDYQKGFDAPSKIRKAWIKKMMKKGLNGFVAFDDGVPAGYFEYCPIEVAPDRVKGRDLTFIVCGLVHLWDRPERKRYTGKGIGRLLIERIEKEARKRTKGIVAWGYDWDNWFMPAPFFRHLGYKDIDSDGNRVLLLKSFKRGITKPKFIKKNRQFKPIKGKIVVDILASEQCPFFIGLVSKWHQAVKDLGRRYQIRVHPLKTNRDFCKIGSGMAILVQGKPAPLGPMSIERIREILIKEGK